MKDYICTCTDEEIEEHTCPYDEDINGDSESMCHCCDYCGNQCAQDI
jgi:hypothetical protein